MMQILKLSETDKYKKFSVIKKVGFEAIERHGKLYLVDKQSAHAEDYIDTMFNNINEIVSVLSGYLFKIGIIVTQ
jgi:hypothetical protein